ncbi:hypothetical protein NL676_030106 [Syzygium grande]|nr:hypothetical protein NL676_030106 [Syzygium grande]
MMEPPPPRLSASSKLRLMCSYNVGMAPCPHSKSLFYHGGETRIVTVDRASVATSPLSPTLAIAPPLPSSTSSPTPTSTPSSPAASTTTSPWNRLLGPSTCVGKAWSLVGSQDLIVFEGPAVGGYCDFLFHQKFLCHVGQDPYLNPLIRLGNGLAVFAYR